MKNTTDHSWPKIQRAVETTALRRPTQFRPFRYLRRLTYTSAEYPPGVYIFAYHTIVDPECANTWERAYDKFWHSKETFARQMAWLCSRMTPTSLTQALEMLKRGPVDKPCFAVTFDDGYSDILANAAPTIARHGLKPCVFVNGRMAQGHVYYRILTAMLTKAGYTETLRDELVSRDKHVAWSLDPLELFNQTKNHYTPGIMEDSTEAAYRKCLGDPAALHVHLNAEEVRQLQAQGWEMGNHTYDHRLLSRMDLPQIDETISRNETFWRGQGVTLIPALAIPNGRVRDVNEHVHIWLREHKDVHALFCNGGVNATYDRTQCLRLSAGNGDELATHEAICAEANRMARVRRRTDSNRRHT